MPVHEEKGIVYVALNVDDNLMIGGIKAINNAVTALKETCWYLRLYKGCRSTCSVNSKFQ